MGDGAEYPPPWAANPAEVGYARKLYDKFKGEHGELERPGFEQICVGLLGNAAAGRKRREQRTVAWFTNKGERDTITFAGFLKVLSGSGVTIKILANNYEDVLDPPKKEPDRLKCPHCREDLPGNYRAEEPRDIDEEVEENEDAKLLRKLEDIERRRATLTQEAQEAAQRAGVAAEEGTGSRRNSTDVGKAPPSPGRLDPRLSRLRADELDAVGAALEKLQMAGFSEVDVPALLRAVRGKRSDDPFAAEPDLSDRFNDTEKSTSPALASTYTAGGSRRESLQEDHPKPRANIVDDRRVSRKSVDAGSAARRKSQPRGSVQRGSVGSAHGGRRRSEGGSRPTTPSAPKGPPAPPPPEPIPDMPLPTGCVRKEDLGAAPLRRTEKLIESVRRCEPKMVKQWAEGGETTVYVDGKVTLLHLAVEQKKASALDIMRTVSTPATIAAFSELGENPAHLAARLAMPEKVRLLAELGADLSAKDARGNSALHLSAVQPNGATTTKVLLELGAPPVQVDSDGATPLHVAVTPEMCAVLLDAGCVAGVPDAKGCNAAHSIISRGVFDAAPEHEALVRLCTPSALAQQDREGDTPLHCAVAHGCARVVDALVRFGADAEKANSNTLTPAALVRRRWQQEAGNAAQQDWSAVMVGLGTGADAIATKGVSWHTLEGDSWVPADSDEHCRCIAERRREVDGSLEWMPPGSDSGAWAWVAAAKELMPGEWGKISCDTVVGWRGAAGDCLLLRYTAAEGGAEVPLELRRLPNA